MTNKNNTAVILHLYYHDLWEEIKNHLNKMERETYDLYVTLTEDSASLGQMDWIKKELKNFNANIFTTPNKGLDIGPFLLVLRYLFQNKIKYNNILKIHTKKGIESTSSKYGIEFSLNWKECIFNSILGSEEKIQQHKDNLKTHEISASNHWVTDHIASNRPYIDEFINLFNLEFNYFDICPGTMFWANYSLFEKYFTLEKIDYVYNSLEEGRFIDSGTPRKTHSMERIFYYFAQQDGKKLGLVDP